MHLTEDNLCAIHDKSEFPAVCRNLRPSAEMCGKTFDEAMAYLTELEKQTSSL